MTRRPLAVALALVCALATTPALARHQEQHSAAFYQVTNYCGERVCAAAPAAPAINSAKQIRGEKPRREARRHPIGKGAQLEQHQEQEAPTFRVGNSSIAAVAERYVGRVPSVAELKAWARETGIGAWRWGQHLYCALGVNKVLADVGVKGSGSFRASSFKSWGQHTNNPQPGDIAVVGSHHVAIVVDRTQSSVVVVSFNDSGHAIRRVEYPLHGVRYRTASL